MSGRNPEHPLEAGPQEPDPTRRRPVAASERRREAMREVGRQPKSPEHRAKISASVQARLARDRRIKELARELADLLNEAGK
jgi:hypothetical protein